MDKLTFTSDYVMAARVADIMNAYRATAYEGVTFVAVVDDGCPRVAIISADAVPDSTIKRIVTELEFIVDVLSSPPAWWPTLKG